MIEREDDLVVSVEPRNDGGATLSGRAASLRPQPASPFSLSGIPSAADTSGLVVVDPFARQLLRQIDGAVVFAVPDDSPIPIDEKLANLDRVSALWNTFCGIDEPAAVVSELFAALAQYRDDLRRPPSSADSIERRNAMIESLIAKLKTGQSR